MTPGPQLHILMSGEPTVTVNHSGRVITQARYLMSVLKCGRKLYCIFISLCGWLEPDLKTEYELVVTCSYSHQVFYLTFTLQFRCCSKRSIHGLCTSHIAGKFLTNKNTLRTKHSSHKQNLRDSDFHSSLSRVLVAHNLLAGVPHMSGSSEELPMAAGELSTAESHEDRRVSRKRGLHSGTLIAAQDERCVEPRIE